MTARNDQFKVKYRPPLIIEFENLCSERMIAHAQSCWFSRHSEVLQKTALHYARQLGTKLPPDNQSVFHHDQQFQRNNMGALRGCFICHCVGHGENRRDGISRPADPVLSATGNLRFCFANHCPLLPSQSSKPNTRLSTPSGYWELSLHCPVASGQLLFCH